MRHASWVLYHRGIPGKVFCRKVHVKYFMADVYDYYFENYLMLYSLYGRGRPTVDRSRFEKLDREMIELLSHSEEGLSGQQVSRVREIEYLLLDDVAESLLSNNYDERIAASEEPGAEEARKRATSHITGQYPPVISRQQEETRTPSDRESAQSSTD